MRPTNQLSAAAVAYASLGYRVLPLHHPIPATATRGTRMLCSCGDQRCGAVGKHPLTPHGLKDATSDPTQLTRWWRRWPQANIGLVTGERADVLDVDGPAGRAALRRFACSHRSRRRRHDRRCAGHRARPASTGPAPGRPSWHGRRRRRRPRGRGPDQGGGSAARASTVRRDHPLDPPPTHLEMAGDGSPTPAAPPYGAAGKTITAKRVV